MPVSRLTLRVKLVLTVMPLVLLFMAWNFTVINQHERDIMQAGTLLRATSVATGLATAAADALAASKSYLLQPDVDAVAKIPDVLSIHIVDMKNEVLADSGRLGGVISDDFSGAAMRASDVISAWDEKGGVLHVGEPIMVDTITGRVRQGTVIVTMNLASMEAALAQSHRYLLLLTIGITAAAVLAMSLIAGWLVRPLLSLVEDARQLAGGNLQKRSVPLRMDETGELAEAFNSLAEKIQEMMAHEQQAREALQQRVSDLLAYTEQVAAGDLQGHAPVGVDDDMGRLVEGFNAMVDDLHQTMEAERTFRRDLEASKQSLEEANEKLKELDKLKSDFLNTVSHELRTPLTSIKAFSEILMENQGEDRAVQTEFLNIINQESDRLTRLINNLLNLSRIEARQMTFETGPVPIETVVSSAVNGTKALMDKKQLKLAVEVSAGLVVMGDQDKLIQVVTNLLSNAIKFTPLMGCLSISAWSADGEMALDINDSGIGIPTEFLEKIFEKFQQVETGNMREVKGSGLGLPIVRGIVEAHGGRVWADSVVGRGSTFHVRLPLHSSLDGRPSSLKIDGEVAAPPLPVRPESGERKGKTVLVVDDEENILKALQLILEQDGHRVVIARTGEEGLEACKKVRPDVVLLDVMLPDIDGFQVLSRLRSDPDMASTPVFFLSILADREQGMQHGAQEYFSKPIDKEKLLEAVSRLVQKTSREDIRILVVDDDSHIRQAVTKHLEQRGYKTLTAGDGLESVVRARDEHPDLIILDIYMPDMDGFEVIRQLRSRDDTCQIPIIVLTASDIPVDEIKAHSLGVQEFMNKPFSEKELARAVRQALGKVAPRTQGRKVHEEDSGR